MISGKTSTGFEFAIDDEKLYNDMKFVDALAEADEGNVFGYRKVVQFMFDEEQRDKLYKHVMAEDGTVPIKKISEEIIEILGANEESKNS